jgi:hypothetical protein
LIVIFNFLTVKNGQKYFWKQYHISTLAFYKLAAVKITIVSIIISVPDTRVGHCLGPEEMGLGRARPPNMEGDKQTTPSKEGGNMEQEEKGRMSQA